MVLRGSKIRPESTYDDATEAVARANAYLAQMRRERRAVEETAEWKQAKETLVRHDSRRETVDSEELYHIIRVLVERIEKMDDAEDRAEEELAAAQSRIQTVLRQLACGGVAGCVARTTVAPIDRVKILMQTQRLTSAGAGGKDRYVSVGQSFREIIRTEGVAGLWRGNGVNCVRVFPYAASQFVSYDKFKSLLARQAEQSGGEFGVAHRLLAGSLAAVTATSRHRSICGGQAGFPI